MPRNTRRTSILAAAPAPAGKNRRISRREREQRQRRYLTIGAIAVSVIVALIAIISSLSFYVLTPNETLATVNGHNISRNDYWKVRRNALLDRLQQYSFQSQLGGAQSDQLQAGADAARMEIKDIRTYAVDPTTLNDMEQDQVVLGALPGIGVTLTDKDVNETVAERFAPVALNTPTPAPTLNPTKQATADAATAGVTQTAVALNAVSTSTAQAAVAAAALTPSSAPPTATVAPTNTAVPTQTPTNMDARATSTATLKVFINERQKDADISLDDYKRLVIRPALARQRAREALEANAPTHGEQIHALHILLPTEDAAKEARRRVVEQGQDFGAVASELSTDTTTKPNGGDLGYAPRGIFVKPFEDAAFALPVNAVSDPVQTEFGWHIIKVIDHPQDRDYDDSVFRQVRDKQFQTWLDDQTKKAQIKASVPTPVPSPQAAFQPPADAPATPTFTPAPSPAMSGTPDPNAIPGAIGTPAMLATPPAGASGAGGLAPTVMGATGATGSPAASGGASSDSTGSGSTGNASGTASSGSGASISVGSTPSVGAGTGPTPIPFNPPVSPTGGAGSSGVMPAAAPTSAPTSVPAVMPAAATVAPVPTIAPIAPVGAMSTAPSTMSTVSP